MIDYFLIFSIYTKSIEPKNVIYDSKESIIYDELIANGLNSNEAKQMLLINKCESRFNSQAQNAHSSAAGLWQITQATWEANSDYLLEQRYDWLANLETAVKIYKKRGAQPWSECI